MSLTDDAFAPGRLHGNGGGPGAVVKAGQIPAGDLQPGVVFFTHAQFVGYGGGGSADKCFVSLDLGDGAVSAGQPQADGQLRGGTPGCFLKIPDIAAEAVLHAVAQQEAQYVFAGDQSVSQIVNVVVHHIVSGGNIGGQVAPGQFDTVEPEPVKAQTADRDLSLGNIIADMNGFP